MVKQRKTFYEHVGTVGDDFFPMLLAGLCNGGLHDFEVLRAVGIGLDVKTVAKMPDVIQQVGLAGLEDTERLVGTIAFHNAAFRRERGLGADDEVFTGFALGDIYAELVIGFVIDFRIIGGRGANAVAKDFVRSQTFVFHAVE